MNIWDYLLILVLAAVLCAAIRCTFINRKKGCGGNCAGCTSSSCKSKKESRHS